MRTRTPMVFGILLLAVAWAACDRPAPASLDSGADLAPAAAFKTAKAAPADRPGRLLATSNLGSVPTGKLVEVDAATGAGTEVADLGNPVVAAAFSAFDGTLYGAMIAVDPDGPPFDFDLIEIDPLSGAIQTVGVLRDAANPAIRYRTPAMTATADGDLLAIHNVFSPVGDLLIRIDPATAQATVIAPLDRGVRNMGATLTDGVLYLLAQRPPAEGNEITLFTVDQTTGVTTILGGTGLFAGSVGLTTGGDGRLLAVIGDSLYEIDPDDGAATRVGATGFVSLSGLAFIDELARRVPCGGPWKNHGAYVSAVADALNALRAAGEITGRQKGQLQAEAARSDCGR